MFRFRELSLHGWDLWPPVRVPLDRDVVLVTGPNGSGKTTLLDAIRQLLNAPRLSSRRRLQNYLRRADQPALLRAVVSNEGAGGGAPFRRERLTTPEVTLACALVPAGGGSPDKRFAVLPGRAPIEEVQRLLLESRDWYGPERYQRALESAGVTKSLMSVLAIEQGRTNSLFELKPRELFRRVLEMLGDHAVLERYRDARRRYEESEREVVRQTSAVQKLDGELRRVQREVDRLDEFEAARDRVRELEARLPAAQLMLLLKGRAEAAVKLPELRTKVRRGEADRVRFEEELAGLREARQAADAGLEAARRAEEDAQAVWTGAHQRHVLAAERLRRLEELAAEAAELPTKDLEALEAAFEAASRILFAAEEAATRAERRELAARESVERLRAGLPVYPAAVVSTLDALAVAGVAPVLLAATVEVADGERARAAEAALGDARFALLVAPESEAPALAVARRFDFPGPVYSGPGVEEPLPAGPLRLAPGAPRWLAVWAKGAMLSADGSWRDERGTWVAPPEGRFLGETGRLAALAEAEAAWAGAREDAAAAAAALGPAQAERASARAALAGERRRRELLATLADLPAARAEAVSAEESLEAASGARARATAGREEAHRSHEGAVADLAAAETRAEQHAARLAGEREALLRTEADLAAAETEIASLAPLVSADLYARSEAGALDGPDTVRNDLETARARLSRLGEPPGPEVRDEATHLRANIEEAEMHLGRRREEGEGAQRELSECRSRYLEVVHGALQDYRRRAVAVAAGADVVVEMELPHLADDDRVLDEAALLTRFGFDGKDPLPLGDPSFSGGQQVIAGLVLLMAMAETEGRGFFMLDEPFAHLSLDRVDQVGRFLRAAGAQFILTAPTTLDRAQLDPASLVIVLQKKRAKEPYAPVPIVAEA